MDLLTHRQKIRTVLKLPAYFLANALMFVCVLSLRDTLKSTVDMIPFPDSNLYWLWLETFIYITIGFVLIYILAYFDLVDPKSFFPQ